MVKYIAKTYMPSALRQLAQRRNSRTISLGTPKSGTTSIAGLFAGKFRYGHEAERDAHVKVIYSHYKGKITDKAYIKYLRKRDKRLWMDIESNCFLGYRPDLTYRALPDYQFILTIRDPWSWLDSIFNNNISFPVARHKTMERWHEVFFQPDKYVHYQDEQILKDFKLYPVDAYLNYWVNANQSVINSIPDEQLLIIPTKNISGSLEVIEDFLGIPNNTLKQEHSFSNVTENKYDVRSKLDEEYIRDRIKVICNDFIVKNKLLDSIKINQ